MKPIIYGSRTGTKEEMVSNNSKSLSCQYSRREIIAMDKMQIPTELKRAVLKKKLIRVILFVLLSVWNIVVVINWWSVLFPVEQINVIASYSIAIIFLALPVFLTRIYKLFTDSNYMGTIRDVKIQTVVDSKLKWRMTLENLYRKNVVYITLETPNGKHIQRKVLESLPAHTENLDKYQVGDQILHLYGTGITIVLPVPNDTRCSCAMCGGNNDISNDVCVHCGKPLIKCGLGRE